MKGAFSAIVTQPATPLLSLAEAKSFIRFEANDDDDDIEAFVAGCTDQVDAEFGELGRALITQTWRLALPEFPQGDRIALPISPVQSITSVTYYDADGAEQTLAAEKYRLIAGADEGFIELVGNEIWPATITRSDAVKVTYVAGYGDAATDVPEGIRQAVRLMVSHWYDNRKAATEDKLSEMPMGVRYILAKYRVPRGHI